MKEAVSVFWFRRDLRLSDNAGLFQALKSGNSILPVFIFDKNILDKLEDKHDARVQFIHSVISEIDNELKELGSNLFVVYGNPMDAFSELLKEFDVKSVYTNHDYEPYAKQRDSAIKTLLEKEKVDFFTFKDQCVLEFDEVLKDDGKPYTVFTPYKNKYLKTLTEDHLKPFLTENYFDSFLKYKGKSIPTLQEMGFGISKIEIPDKKYKDVLKDYAEKRNFPSIEGTSRISLHLRFGTVSIRKLANDAKKQSDVWFSELIWRDFYFQILAHFPHVAKGSFRPEYDKINWRNNENEFAAWCEGKTGYPIVDAGMRQLNESGFMHNRVRMIVASFLTKHLLIDWRWGEAYFAKKLLDFELSSNNGGWQWAAGSGTDAAPYFRIFNPEEQIKKFDKDLKYIKRWVPEFQEFSYPKPIVDHKFARERCLRVYAETLKNKE